MYAWPLQADNIVRAVEHPQCPRARGALRSRVSLGPGGPARTRRSSRPLHTLHTLWARQPLRADGQPELRSLSARSKREDVTAGGNTGREVGNKLRTVIGSEYE